MSLQTRLTRWKELNFITQAQCEQILTFERQRAGQTFWRTAFIIAGSLIGLGVCLLVAANWHALGNVFKLTGAFALLGSAFAATYGSITHQRKGLTELFAILSFLLIGATIGLIGQVFNLEGGWQSFALAWALLGLPFVAVSRSVFFNMGWLCLLGSLVDGRWWERVLDFLWDTFDANTITLLIVLCLLSYAGNRLHKTTRPYTVVSLAFSKLTLWLAYVFVWFIGMRWGTHGWTSHFGMCLAATVCTLAFFAGRMYWALRTQNLSSFKRNAFCAEIFIFILFISGCGNLFLSGLGFIAGGLAVLGMIYVFKRTSRYIKTMEAFHEK